MKDKNQDIKDIIDFVIADDSDLSGLSYPDDSDHEPEAITNRQEQKSSDYQIDDDKSEECDDDKLVNVN